MDTDQIKRLKEQTEGMELSQINLKEAIQALYNIIIELSEQVNEIQRELDDYDKNRMEQNERR